MLPLVALLLLGSIPAQADEIWGGMWNNTWMVFFQIDDVKKPTKVIYRWQENVNRPMMQQTFKGKSKKGVIKDKKIIRVGGMIRLKLTGLGGIAWGDFVQPRRTNLVRLNIKDIKEANRSTLLKAGWKPSPKNR